MFADWTQLNGSQLNRSQDHQLASQKNCYYFLITDNNNNNNNNNNASNNN